MKETDLDVAISGLASTLLLSGKECFEDTAKTKALELTASNIDYLLSRLHNPPIVDSRIDVEKITTWTMAINLSIFELIYHSNINTLELLKKYAYEKYDWTQAIALEVICRMYVNGKISYDIISEIDKNLISMEYQTHVYFAQGLIAQANRDERFWNIINQIANVDFQNTVREMTDRN